MPLAESDRQILLDAARQSIEFSLAKGKTLNVDPAEFPKTLQNLGASFVTLKRNGKLRGCVGMLEAVQPLILDVIHSAHAAAFRDNRFPALTRAELEGLDIYISVLSPTEKITFASEADLLTKIRPGIDGLVLSEGWRRGTFLPVMWEELPTPREFLTNLKIKAGLPSDYWSDTIEMERYTVEKIP